MALRKNASLASVADFAFRKANQAFKKYVQLRDYCDRKGREGHVTSDERQHRDKAWEHFFDLDAVSDHLQRLAGKTKDEVDKMKDAARYPNRTTTEA